MVTYHIAGVGSDAGFAEVEQAADFVAANLPSITVVKYIRPEEEWSEFCHQICGEHGFKHDGSPLVWTGSGLKVGGKDDFFSVIMEKYKVSRSDWEGKSVMKKIIDENVQIAETEKAKRNAAAREEQIVDYIKWQKRNVSMFHKLIELILQQRETMKNICGKDSTLKSMYAKLKTVATLDGAFERYQKEVQEYDRRVKERKILKEERRLAKLRAQQEEEEEDDVSDNESNASRPSTPESTISKSSVGSRASRSTRQKDDDSDSEPEIEAPFSVTDMLERKTKAAEFRTSVGYLLNSLPELNSEGHKNDIDVVLKQTKQSWDEIDQAQDTLAYDAYKDVYDKELICDRFMRNIDKLAADRERLFSLVAPPVIPTENEMMEKLSLDLSSVSGGSLNGDDEKEEPKTPPVKKKTPIPAPMWDIHVVSKQATELLGAVDGLMNALKDVDHEFIKLRDEDQLRLKQCESFQIANKGVPDWVLEEAKRRVIME